MPLPDYLTADTFSPLGEQAVLIVDAATWAAPAVPIQSVIIGFDRAGNLPGCEASLFDTLLTVAASPPAPWVCVDEAQLDRIVGRVRRWPIASAVLCQTLRLSEMLPFSDALTTESLAYSGLLGGEEFRLWHSSQKATLETEPGELILIERDQDHIMLTLNNPSQQNAMTAAMRDALYAALANALDDPTSPTVSLRGAGKCFSTGGSLAEFGTAQNLAEAHLVRTLHSCARLIDILADRCDVHFHGACVGSGLEVPAAAARRTASPNSWFQLPELHMGLNPGAGGTASISRAIGRHRTAWLALSGQRLGARKALEWGLVNEIREEQSGTPSPPRSLSSAA